MHIACAHITISIIDVKMFGFFIILLFMVASCDAVCKENQFDCADGKQVLQNRYYICNHDKNVSIHRTK